MLNILLSLLTLHFVWAAGGELPVDEWALVNSDACVSGTSSVGKAFDVSSEYTTGTVGAVKLVYVSGCVRGKSSHSCTKWGTGDEKMQFSMLQDDDTLTHAFPIRGETSNVEHDSDTNDFQFYVDGVTSSTPDYMELIGPNQPLASSYRLIWKDGVSSPSDNSGSSCFEVYMKQVATPEPTYEPTMATLEPTMATDEPTMATLEPTMATLEPTMATDEPTMATLEPTMATDEPTMATLEPTMATDEPTMKTVEPTEATDEPTMATDEPTMAAPSAMPSPGEVVTKAEADSSAPLGDDVATSNSSLTDIVTNPIILAAGCGGGLFILCGLAYFWCRSISSKAAEAAAAANSADVDAENPPRRSYTKEPEAVPTRAPEAPAKKSSSKPAVATNDSAEVDAENPSRRSDTKGPQVGATEAPGMKTPVNSPRSPELTSMNMKDTSFTEYNTFRGEGAPNLTLRDEAQTLSLIWQVNGELEDPNLTLRDEHTQEHV